MRKAAAPVQRSPARCARAAIYQYIYIYIYIYIHVSIY